MNSREVALTQAGYIDGAFVSVEGKMLTVEKPSDENPAGAFAAADRDRPEARAARLTDSG